MAARTAATGNAGPVPQPWKRNRLAPSAVAAEASRDGVDGRLVDNRLGQALLASGHEGNPAGIFRQTDLRTMDRNANQCVDFKWVGTHHQGL
jgi:hypothetical protein